MHKSTRTRIHLTRRYYVRLVFVEGVSRRQAARRAGVHHRTIGRWIDKAETLGGYDHAIPTASSRPRRPAGQLPVTVEARIIALRARTGRCAPVIAELLRREDIDVAASTVGRVLRRAGLTRPRPRAHPARMRRGSPVATVPGELVAMDAVHIDRPDGQRSYVITVLDVASRWAHAGYTERLSQAAALRVLTDARDRAPFPFRTVQTDHGSEFGRKFARTAIRDGLRVVRTRLHTPNDNAHVERFNRTLRGECLPRLPLAGSAPAQTIARYIEHYNGERPHMALGLKAPLEMLAPARTSMTGARGLR